MPHMPVLRVVPLESIRRHEEIDPLRVDRLVDRINEERVQVNPMVCIRTRDDELVLLDGATRTESLRQIGLRHAVVQLVPADEVELETWHHVIRGCEPDELVGELRQSPGLSEGFGPPALHLNDGRSFVIHATKNRDLSTLVGKYVGRWTVNRVAEPSLQTASRRFPDWTAMVEFPTLSMDDVMAAAVGDDLLPPGITRFLVPERALRANVPLDLLRDGDSLEAKQAALDRLLEERSMNGRVRRYEETVFILDD